MNKPSTHSEIQQLKANLDAAEERLSAARRELQEAKLLRDTAECDLRTAMHGPYRSPCYA